MPETLCIESKGHFKSRLLIYFLLPFTVTFGLLCITFLLVASTHVLCRITKTYCYGFEQSWSKWIELSQKKRINWDWTENDLWRQRGWENVSRLQMSWFVTHLNWQTGDLCFLVAAVPCEMIFKGKERKKREAFVDPCSQHFGKRSQHIAFSIQGWQENSWSKSSDRFLRGMSRVSLRYIQ